MNFRIHQIFLSLFFALAFCFSLSIEASAHVYQRSDGQRDYTHSADIDISAADVSPTDKAQMKKLLLHLATHTDLIKTDPDLDEITRQEKSREYVIFGREIRQEGVFNNGEDVYSIAATTMRGYIANHGRYQNLYGYRYDSSEDPLQTLLGDTVPELSDGVDPVCATYDNGNGANRVACAVRLETPAGTEITLMTGFHHAEEADIVRRPDCRDFTLTVTAKDVEEENDPAMKKELLKQYVQGVIGRTQKLINDTGVALAKEGILPASPRYIQHFTTRVYESLSCYQKEPDLRYGSIYAFIMDPRRGVAFLSGNDFTRNGLSVSLNDPNPPKYDGTHEEPNILTAIHRTLTGTTPPEGTADPNDIEHGDSGFFTYHWAHPANTALNTPDYLSRCVVPGRALKESYIEVVDVSRSRDGRSLFVFGSGIYLDEGMIPDESMENLCPVTDDGDDGCAIAAAGNIPQSALFNLFLIASILFSAVFLKRRA